MIKAYIRNEQDIKKQILGTPSGYIGHPLFPQLSMQRINQFIKVRVSNISGNDSYNSFEFDRQLYDCGVFENDENWRLIKIQVYNFDSAVGIEYLFESTIKREVRKVDYRGWNSRSTDVDSGIEYMHFTGPENTKAIVALNHTSQREFRYYASRAGVEEIFDVRYEYAVFNNDESIEFNVRPTASGAKAVTVLYLGKRVDQL